MFAVVVVEGSFLWEGSVFGLEFVFFGLVCFFGSVLSVVLPESVALGVAFGVFSVLSVSMCSSVSFSSVFSSSSDSQIPFMFSSFSSS